MSPINLPATRLLGAPPAPILGWGCAASTTVLTHELEGATALLHMEDGKANALSDAMIGALLDALDRA